MVDESPGGAIDHRVNTTIVQHALATLIAQERRDHGNTRHLDVAVVSLHVAALRDSVVVSAKVRITVSADHGTLLQVIAGGARVEIAKRAYRERRLAELRDDALTGAVQAVFRKVKRSYTPPE